MEELLAELNNMNPIELLELFKPIIIGLASNRFLVLGTKHYSLRRDFKVKDVKIVKPPILEDIPKIKIAEEFKKEFVDALNNFISTLQNKCPHYDLSLLARNLPTLTFKDNYNFHNFIFGTRTAATYHTKLNLVRIGTGENLESVIYHEFFHMSSNYLGDNLIGFSQGQIGDGLNEGYAELLNERYFLTKPSSRYIIEKFYAEQLEKIIGQQKMETLYSKADLFGLIEELKKYTSYENIIKFLSRLDFVYKHRNDRYIMGEKALINNALEYMVLFLIQTYKEKIFAQLKNNIINEDEAKQLINVYLNSFKVTFINNIHRFKLLSDTTLSAIGATRVA